MKVTLHLEGTRQEVVDQLAEFKTVMETSLEAQASPKGKRGKRAKKEEAEEETAAVEAEEIEEVEETEAEESEESDSSDDEEVEEESEEEVEESAEDDEDAPKGPSLKDVTAALRKFASRGKESKNKAMKILKKYKIEHIDDLPKKFYKEVLKQLK